MVKVLTKIKGHDTHSPAPMGFFLFSNPSTCPKLPNSDHVVVSVSIHKTQNRMSLFIANLMIIIVLTEAVFKIICEMF